MPSTNRADRVHVNAPVIAQVINQAAIPRHPVVQLAQYRGVKLYVARNGFDSRRPEMPQLFHIATDGIEADLGAGEFQADVITDTCHRLISGR